VINFDRDAPAACVSGEGILAFPRLMTRVLISSLAISFLLFNIIKLVFAHWPFLIGVYPNVGAPVKTGGK
jgi:hypothetical protein